MRCSFFSRLKQFRRTDTRLEMAYWLAWICLLAPSMAERCTREFELSDSWQHWLLDPRAFGYKKKCTSCLDCSPAPASAGCFSVSCSASLKCSDSSETSKVTYPGALCEQDLPTASESCFAGVNFENANAEVWRRQRRSDPCVCFFLRIRPKDLGLFPSWLETPCSDLCPPGGGALDRWFRVGPLLLSLAVVGAPYLWLQEHRTIGASGFASLALQMPVLDDGNTSNSRWHQFKQKHTFRNCRWKVQLGEAEGAVSRKNRGTVEAAPHGSETMLNCWGGGFHTLEIPHTQGPKHYD